MLSLLQHTDRPAEPLALLPPVERRSPGAAFTLSLLFPGLGHAYLRRWQIAAWTAGSFLLCLLCMFSETPAFLGMFLIGVPALYLFGAADAFCAAREWNAGVEGRLIGTNPRVATILNLLTKGFGYFYLGQRAKGIAVIVVMMAMSPLLQTRWLSLAAIALQLLIAADGYRVARQQLLEANPELAPGASAAISPFAAPEDSLLGRTVPPPPPASPQPHAQQMPPQIIPAYTSTPADVADPNSSLVAVDPTASSSVRDDEAVPLDPIAAANRGTLQPAVVTAILVLLAAVALFGVFDVSLTNGRANHAPGTVEIDGDGLHYRNAALGIALTAPEGWDMQPPGTALVHLQNGSCVVSITDNTVLLGGGAFPGGIRKGLLQQYPNATFGPAAPWHGTSGRVEGMTIAMPVHDRIVHENWFGLRHGTHLTSFFEAYPADNATCAADFQQIESSLRFR